MRRIEVAADGGLTVRTLSEVPARPAAVRGIALAGGQLVTKEEDSAPRPSYQTRKVTLTGTPSAGERSEVTTAPLGDSYGQPLGAGDGSVVHVRHDDVTQRDVLVRATAAGARTEVVPFDAAPPRPRASACATPPGSTRCTAAATSGWSSTPRRPAAGPWCSS